MTTHRAEPPTTPATAAARPASRRPFVPTTMPGTIACPACQHPMHDVRGSRHAICPNCGFKDACCY